MVDATDRVLQTDHAKAIYQQRKVTVEPVFGQMKFNRRFDRFQRRGRAARRSEWRLFGASHNLLKLHPSHSLWYRRGLNGPEAGDRRAPRRLQIIVAGQPHAFPDSHVQEEH